MAKLPLQAVSGYPIEFAELQHGEPVICPSCGMANAADQQACLQCGAPLPAISAQPEPVGQPGPPPAVSQPVERGGCLSAWLFVSMVAGLIAVSARLSSFVTLQPEIATLLSSAAEVACAVGAIGIWKWKKWGVYLTIGAAAIALATLVDSYLIGAMGLGRTLLLAAAWAIAVGIFYVLIKPVYSYLR